MGPEQQMHQPGPCGDEAYCDGWARYVVDPFSKDIHDEVVYMWLCSGQLQARRDAI